MAQTARDSEFARAARDSFGSINRFARDLYSSLTSSNRNQRNLIQETAEEAEHERVTNSEVKGSVSTIDDLIQLNNNLLRQFRELSSNIEGLVSSITGGGGVGTALGALGLGLGAATLPFMMGGPEETDLSDVPNETGGVGGGDTFDRGEGGVQQALNFDGDSSPEELMQIASSQLGMNERRQNAALREYLRNGGVNLDPAETAWCAAFVNATLEQTGLPGTGSLLARSFLDYGEPVENPQVGDLVIFSRGDPNSGQGHVGFFQGFDGNGNIRVLGGNQGDGNGGGVTEAVYSHDRLLGYRRPPYQMGETAEEVAEETGAGAETAIPLQVQPTVENNVDDVLYSEGGLDSIQGGSDEDLLSSTIGSPPIETSITNDVSEPIINQELLEPQETTTIAEPEQLLFKSSQQKVEPVAFEPEQSQPEVEPVAFEPEQSQPEVEPVAFEPEQSQPEVEPVAFEPERSQAPIELEDPTFPISRKVREETTPESPALTLQEPETPQQPVKANRPTISDRIEDWLKGLSDNTSESRY